MFRVRLSCVTCVRGCARCLCSGAPLLSQQVSRFPSRRCPGLSPATLRMGTLTLDLDKHRIHRPGVTRRLCPGISIYTNLEKCGTSTRPNQMAPFLHQPHDHPRGGRPSMNLSLSDLPQKAMRIGAAVMHPLLKRLTVSTNGPGTEGQKIAFLKFARMYMSQAIAPLKQCGLPAWERCGHHRAGGVHAPATPWHATLGRAHKA